ncbi:unnamed protein product [Lampetra fluviatilis]
MAPRRGEARGPRRRRLRPLPAQEAGCCSEDRGVITRNIPHPPAGAGSSCTALPPQLFAACARGGGGL